MSSEEFILKFEMFAAEKKMLGTVVVQKKKEGEKGVGIFWNDRTY